MKRSEITRYQGVVRQILAEAGIPLAPQAEVEVADFGANRFEKTGLGLVLRINEPEYCSKWLILLPGQNCPPHYHRAKKETFFVHSGRCFVKLDEREIVLQPGESRTMEPGVVHEFWSDVATVVEEVSMHDDNSDSYFLDPTLVREPRIEED
jgi:D-lyxose ketol-isomerase